MQVLFFGLSQTLTPDVVLMDIEMPGMDGIEATAALRRVVPQSVVMILVKGGYTPDVIVMQHGKPVRFNFRR